MRVRQAHRTEEAFKMAENSEKIAVESNVDVEVKADEKDANLLGDVFRLKAPRRIEAPFLFFPKCITKATEDDCNDKVPVKKCIEKHLYYVGIKDDKEVLLRPTDCIIQFSIFKEFMSLARGNKCGDNNLLK
jgi:hypothetical protein